jgi:hypothetical protein
MSSVTIKVYRTVEPSWKRELNPDSLVKVLSIETDSVKRLNKQRAKKILARVFPELGKVWYVWEHEQGWQKLIKYDGKDAWVLVCRD